MPAPVDTPDKTIAAATVIIRLSALKSNHFSIILPHGTLVRGLSFG
jgi:hypothetical protein